MSNPVIPARNHGANDNPVAEIWWGEAGDLRRGRVAGRISSGGWRWKVSSEGAIWLWLNREGSGLVWGENDRFVLKPGMYAMTGGGKAGDWSCVRYPGLHTLEVVVISREWLFGRLGKNMEWLHPDLGKWLRDGGPVAFCGLMGVWERDLCEALAAVEAGPSQLIAEARVLEWAAVRLFRGKSNESGGFCTLFRDRDPVKRAIHLLRERLDQPLDLTAIAKEVGVAPHHLSRRVSSETGTTLQRHLRRLRIERACEALDSGKMNVTEVALEVGYQSLSHFAKAFREETGESPSKRLGRNDA
ncbi:MAG: AraC family transcriptional regulator [Luteolibacter sp.]|uniref:AraC family transcriptional regulator n=1 Tax=Luteolibacter sp. TaxID=1962973 RepID=UPI003264FBB7